MKGGRRSQAATVVALAVALSGCATYSTYTCPDPIGPIVRQDCDDYKVRYESLKAELKVSIGSFSIGGGLGKEHLRDPSELVQVMMHRMLALCHDYNACRITNDEYRRRRDEADRVFTAVMAVLEQLKNPNLGAEERKRLSGELIAILEGRGETSGAGPAARRKPSRIPRPFRNAFMYWTEGRHLPPAPARKDRYTPFLVDIEQSRVRGKLAGIFITLWGDVQADDVLSLGDGIECKLSRKKGRPIARARCRGDFGNRTRFDAVYTPGATGSPVGLGTVDLEAESSRALAWLAYQPEPLRSDPTVGERPYLVVELPVTGRSPSVTARCRRNGDPVKAADGSSTFVLEPRHGLYGAAGRLKFAAALPFVLAHSADSRAPGGMQGSWRCTVSTDGLPMYRVSFEITQSGTPAPHERQRGRPGDVASPWWLLSIEPAGDDKS